MYSIPTTYTYPDGTKSTTRPADGQVFIVWDKYTQIAKETWQWDDHLEQWFNISSGAPTKHNTKTFVIPNAAPITPPELDPAPWSAKCECGARHTSFPQLHLSFCPLFTP